MKKAVLSLTHRSIVGLMPILVVLFLLTGAVSSRAQCSAANTFLYAYDFSTDHLLRFTAGNPGTPILDVPITGLNAGESLIGLDIRPATGQLYAIASNQITWRLVTVNPTTGALTQVAAMGNAPLAAFFGTDFNPVVDLFRVVDDAQGNRRINPTTGAITTDAALTYAAGDPGAGSTPNVVQIAYANNLSGIATTTLYGIDTARDVLVTVGSVGGAPVSPNSGQLFTVGPLGVDVSSFGGFDISGISNTAYAALRTGGVSTLYSINLATGAATSLGAIGNGTIIDGLAIGGCATAAQASVSGRVLTPNGRPLANATVVVATQNGETHTVLTSSFGNYSFDGLDVGQTYILAVQSKRYRFTSKSVQLVDSVSDLDFIGQE